MSSPGVQPRAHDRGSLEPLERDLYKVLATDLPQARRLAFGSGAGADARSALGAFYLGEAVKLAVVIGLLVVVLKVVRVAPLAMFAAFAATLLVYWIALLAALPALGGARRGA